MIKFALNCDNGHEFESWFSSSDAFESQTKQALVACPFCTSTAVKKALMGPNISPKTNKTVSPKRPRQNQVESHNGNATDKETVALADQVISKIKETAEDVGDKFADEARKIHYEESPDRPIWGIATGNETKDLIAEGIGVLPLPKAPKDHN